VHPQSNLPQIVAALSPPGRLASGLHRREQQGDQAPHDTNDDEQLYESESAAKWLFHRNLGQSFDPSAHVGGWGLGIHDWKVAAGHSACGHATLKSRTVVQSRWNLFNT
jgi:hypothetical protein